MSADLIDPAIFVGLSPEEARAEALQAERAAVFKAWGGAKTKPRRWFTHGVLPPDPRPHAPHGRWEVLPWDVVSPAEQLRALGEPVFVEGLSARAIRVLAMLHELKRASRRFREIHLAG